MGDETSSQAQRDEEQRAKIAEEKSSLTRQLLFLVILSFLISGAFYGITMAQNPYLKAENN